MAETEGQYRRKYEAALLEARVRDAAAGRREARTGQFIGLAVAAAAIVTAGVVAVRCPGATGTWVGSVLGGGVFASLIAALLAGRKMGRSGP